MAAVTTANVPVFLLLSIVFGIQSGLGILISQYWGKKDLQNISRAIGVASMIGAAAALVLLPCVNRINNQINSIAYFEPFYLKEFVAIKSKSLLEA